MSDPTPTSEQARGLATERWLLLAAGGLSLVTGVIVLVKPSHSLTTLAVVCGVFVLIDSLAEVMISLFAEHGGAGAVLGVLGVIIGILLIRHPVKGVLAVALLVGLWLVAIGVIRLLRAIALERRVWSFVVALIEILAGIVIVSSPHIGFSTLALLVGISFLANGLALLALGWIVHLLRREVLRLGPDTAMHVT